MRRHFEDGNLSGLSMTLSNTVKINSICVLLIDKQILTMWTYARISDVCN